MGVESYIQEYYADNAKKINQVVDKIFYKKYGGVTGRDMDTFYSVANDVITDIWFHNRYDPSKGDFGGFLYCALDLAIIDELKSQIRDKRCSKIEVDVSEEDRSVIKRKIPIPDICIDKPIGEDESGTLKDMLSSNFDLEKEVNIETGSNAQIFLNSLLKTQRKIAEMLVNGYTSSEIKEQLNLSEKKYANYLNRMSTVEKKVLLKNKEYVHHEEDKAMQTQTSEKSKKMQFSISSLNKKYESYTFKFDHPTQRASGRWPAKMKGNLISDVLQDNPLPELVFAEKIIDGMSVTYNLDGKQKCTNIYDFFNDGFKICKNIKRPIIEYQTPETDEDGLVKLNERGLPEKLEQKTFDIRGKKYSDLPEELKDRFNDYTFSCVQYLNCSDKDIEYHIGRYNEGVPMTKTEKGIGVIGTKYATTVKEIASMPFFMDCGDYKTSEFRNGTIERIIIESVMSANFLEDWKKQPEDMCEYIKANATTENFENIEDLIDRLENVSTEDISDLFNSKDSFLWFGLFSRFAKSGLDDNKFVEFMREFNQSLRNKKIGEKSFHDLCYKPDGKAISTKDKNVVVEKINHMELLMNEFLHIIKTEDSEETLTEVITTYDLIKETVKPDVMEEDIIFYSDMLNDLKIEVDNCSILLDKENFPSLIAIVAYACEREIDMVLDKWFTDFFRRKNTYDSDQKQNYLNMKDDLDLCIQIHNNRHEQKTA